MYSNASVYAVLAASFPVTVNLKVWLPAASVTFPKSNSYHSAAGTAEYSSADANSLGFAVPIPSDYNPAVSAKADAFDETIAGVLGKSEIQVVPHVVEGEAARSLLEVAKGADLLVVGSRGHGPFAGALLGSVRWYSAAHSTCPVVVVRHQQDELV